MQNLTRRQIVLLLVAVAVVAFIAARLGASGPTGASGLAAPAYTQPSFSDPGQSGGPRNVNPPPSDLSGPLRDMNPVQQGQWSNVRDLNPVRPSQQQTQREQCQRLGYTAANWPDAGCR